MTDVVTKAVRSRMMAGIKGRDTKPERIVRSYLHRSGLRFRIQGRDLPGRPDIILPKWGCIVMVHGCFWHRHRNCRYAAVPGTRASWWQAKFDSNQARDKRNAAKLRAEGWRVLVVWECQLNKKGLVILFNKIVSEHPC